MRDLGASECVLVDASPASKQVGLLHEAAWWIREYADVAGHRVREDGARLSQRGRIDRRLSARLPREAVGEQGLGLLECRHWLPFFFVDPLNRRPYRISAPREMVNVLGSRQPVDELSAGDPVAGRAEWRSVLDDEGL